MEKKFGFCLKKSIEIASKRPLLLNYKFYATKSCTPPPEQIKGKSSEHIIDTYRRSPSLQA